MIINLSSSHFSLFVLLLAICYVTSGVEVVHNVGSSENLQGSLNSGSETIPLSDDSELDDDSEVTEDETSGDLEPDLLVHQQQRGSSSNNNNNDNIDSILDTTTLVSVVVNKPTKKPPTVQFGANDGLLSSVDDNSRQQQPSSNSDQVIINGNAEASTDSEDLLSDPDSEDLADPDDDPSENTLNSNSNDPFSQSPISSTYVMVTYQSSRSKLIAIISKPGIMAGIIGGAVIGLLTAMLLIMFIVYRMRKKDEGSYALEETKKPLNAYDYRHCPTKEFYA